MKGKRETCSQEGRSKEICQMLLRSGADADGFLCFAEDAYKIHGFQVLLVLCRKCQNQLAGNVILSLLFPNAETHNIRISSLSRWEWGGDVGETCRKHEPQNALSAFQWTRLYMRWHWICLLGELTVTEWRNAGNFKNLRNSCLAHSWECSWPSSKAREKSRENQHSERWAKARGHLISEPCGSS